MGRPSASVSYTPTPAHTALISGKKKKKIKSPKQTGEGKQCPAAEAANKRAAGLVGRQHSQDV